MTAAVWIAGGPTDDNRDDLRHSLRSVAANAPDITEAWVIGDVPAWFAGVAMPLAPIAEKFANQRQSIERFVNYPGAPDRFYLFNDDMFITERVEGQLPTCRNKATLSGWARIERSERRLNTWHRAVISTGEWTGQRIGTDPHVYECHTPLLFDTARLRDAVNDYPPGRPFAVGELYPLAGAGGVGEHCGNAKVKHEALAEKMALPMPYLSGAPGSWAGDLGTWVKAQWGTPSGWER